MMVIIVHPDLCLFPYLVDFLKYVLAKNPSSIGTVKPFHKGILGRFAGLNVFKFYLVHLAPIVRYMGNELWAVVHSYPLWFPFFIDEMVVYSDDTVAGQGKVDFYVKCFPIKIIDDVERPEASPVFQDIGYKVHTPGVVQFIGNL